MRVTLRLFAGLREIVGSPSLDLDLPNDATPAAALARLQADYPRLAERTARVAFAVNREYAPADRPLSDGDEVALIPPVSGGQAPASGRRTETNLFEIVEEPIDPLAVQRKVEDPACGAICLFSGVVRNHAGGREVDHLEYEAFEEMALAKLVEVGAETRARFGVPRVAITHRIGRLEVGEISVCIAVASPHRREAFEACHFAIDRLKEVVPIWKKEFTPTGEYWVEPHS